jgi:hypothetical protein
VSRAKKPAAGITESDAREAVGYIDGAIGDILDSWAMRDPKPNGNLLMSALSCLRTARDMLDKEVS